MRTNPELPQDRVEDLIDNWRKYGYTMFRQQKLMYAYLAERVYDRTVLEAGCGVGQGTARFSLNAASVIGTDKGESNVRFAAELYPWVKFQQWDVTKPWPGKPQQVLISVEMIEHVADAGRALRNMADACTKELWISTPNGAGKPSPPENPQHVYEWTPAEFIALAHGTGMLRLVEVLGWEDFAEQKPNTKVDPLVYHFAKR